jgi:hypothetical protein
VASAAPRVLPKSDRVLGTNPAVAAKSDRLDLPGAKNSARLGEAPDKADASAARPLAPQRPLDLTPARSAGLRPGEGARATVADRARPDRKRIVDADTGSARNAALR